MVAHLFISNSDDMKRVFVLFVLFLSASFVADRLLGLAFYKVFSSSDCTENYVHRQCDADVVILGSSRAKHHYVPSIITDSLGLSCYNLGGNGKNIYYQYANMQLLLTHHTPKIVIYDCFSVDVQKADFKYDFGSLSDLYPIYGRNNNVDTLIELQGMQYVSRIKCSHLFRYNSRFIEYLTSHQSGNNQGYEPLSGEYNKDLSIHYENENLVKDETKIAYMQKLIDICKDRNIQIVFSVSPRYVLNEIDAPMTKKYECVSTLCRENSVPFLYYELDNTFLSNGKLFRDVGHLNDKGARQFTKQFVGDLRKVVHN